MKLPYAPDVTPASKLPALLREMVGWSYGLGCKIIPPSLQGTDLMGTSEDGIHVTKVDCSGFVQWAIYHLTAGTLQILDGTSTDQYNEFQSSGYSECTVEDGHLTDGILRLAYLSPENTSDDIGHILLICDGMTYESRGSVGPSTQQWGAQGYHRLMKLLVLG